MFLADKRDQVNNSFLLIKLEVNSYDIGRVFNKYCCYIVMIWKRQITWLHDLHELISHALIESMPTEVGFMMTLASSLSNKHGIQYKFHFKYNFNI